MTDLYKSVVINAFANDIVKENMDLFPRGYPKSKSTLIFSAYTSTNVCMWTLKDLADETSKSETKQSRRHLFYLSTSCPRSLFVVSYISHANAFLVSHVVRKTSLMMASTLRTPRKTFSSGPWPGVQAA